MPIVTFPCCQSVHNVRAFHIKMMPVEVKATVYTDGINYRIDNINPEATISEETFRHGLLDKEKNTDESVENYVTAICPRCNQETKLSKLQITNTCGECGKSTHVKLCKRRGFYICKSCAKNMAHCGCPAELDCYTGEKENE